MTNDYTVLADTPRLGKAGATVHLHPRQAEYWIRANVLELASHERAAKPVSKPDKQAKPADRKVGADRGRNTGDATPDADKKVTGKKTDGEKA